jgi:2-keto-4-pentenoate hydratase/2-oxohepta-3-ene-1,7-dioic acid hydratase in catechol pathway
LRQDGSTRDMLREPAEIIATISQLCTLEPGDVIATGTPSGVGLFSGRFLRPGNRVRVEIEGIGAIENEVVEEPLNGSSRGPRADDER